MPRPGKSPRASAGGPAGAVAGLTGAVAGLAGAAAAGAGARAGRSAAPRPAVDAGSAAGAVTGVTGAVAGVTGAAAGVAGAVAAGAGAVAGLVAVVRPGVAGSGAAGPAVRRSAGRAAAVVDRAVRFAVAFGATRVAHGQLLRRPPGSAASWERTNHAGRTVHTQAGAAVALGTALAALPGAPAVLATVAGAACGRHDDLRGDERRGFRAHLTALRHGEVTSGAVKLLGIGAAGLVAGALLKERPLDMALAGVVVAGTAHLVNLVDVRPGRAGLLVLGLGAPGLLRGSLPAAPMGAAAAVLADDLAERTMLGDMGAHALGAALGTSVAAVNGRLGLAAHAAGLVAAAVYGERVSELARASAPSPALTRVGDPGR